MNILFTSSGRRVGLIKSFRACDLVKKIFTADLSADVASRFYSDGHNLVPRVDCHDYAGVLLDICLKKSIDVVIPLIDPELIVLAANKNRFADVGCTVIVSDFELCKIFFDKQETASYFDRYNIRTPIIYSTQEALKQIESGNSVFVKPAKGSSGVGAKVIRERSELEHHLHSISEPLIQEYIHGNEYTVDALFSRESELVCAVPRRRLAVRAGEIEKGVTERNGKIIEAVIGLSAHLKGAFGCLTIQCFLNDSDEVVFIEINPRFGGGFPLSFKAGANYPAWLLKNISGESLAYSECMQLWKENMLMLRYDEAVYVDGVNCI